MKNRNPIVTLVFTAAVLLLGGLLLSGCVGPTDSMQELEIYLEPFPVVPEGEQPRAPLELRFPASDQPRLLWITGLRTEMINEDDSPATEVPAYRTDIGFDYVRHARIHRLPVYHTDRLLILTPRQTGVTFPDGFGLPFYNDEVLTLNTKLLAASQPAGAADLRQRVVLEFVFDRNLDEPMKPLFATAGRWIESPEGGRDRVLQLPYDTHAHYITTPLRPRAGSVELRDLSSGATVYNSTRNGNELAARAKDTAYFSGEDGIALSQEHSYLLVDDYDDPPTAETGSDTAMLLYLRDKEFKKRPRELAPVAHHEEPIKISDDRLVLHTNHGDIEIAFYPEVAPRHYKQITELARLGVYDGVRFHRIEPGFLVQLGYPEERIGPPLTKEQSAALRRLESEFSNLPMKRWTVAMTLNDNSDPDSAVASFFMLLEETRRIDQRYTIIGRVIAGLGTLNTIAEIPQENGTPVEPVFIEKAEVKTVAEINIERMGRRNRSDSAPGQ